MNRRVNNTILTDVTSVEELLATLNESNATYASVTQSVNISARFCEPEIRIPSRENSIQLLVHGITYTKSYRSALGFPGYQPEIYSWVDFASKNGYPTLAIDRPGNGDSSRPDPFWQDQIPFHAAVLKQIADGLRSKKWLPRNFQQIVYIGHSLGSNIGNVIAASYPDSMDAMVLTGFTKTTSSELLIKAGPVPAVTFAPRFANLSSGYIVTAKNEGRQVLLYGRDGTYDPSIANFDYDVQNTVAIGELGTETAPIASNYTRPVTIVTGEQDAVFCFRNATTLGHCGHGEASMPAQARSLFPNASSFDYFIPEHIGHDVNLHYRAPEAYAYVHAWLASHAF